MNKRVTVFSGHYGSGKTNVSVNYALLQKKTHDKVMLADLDIVNPYFRSKDSEEMLKKAGVRFISSEYANSNVDVPALPAEAYALTADLSSQAVIDVGGDDRGALALGRYAPYLKAEGSFEMLFVVNKFRPLTRTPAMALGIMKEIENASKMRFSGIVNNSNIGDITTAQDVISSFDYANELSHMSGLEIKFTSVRRDLEAELKEKIENVFPIDIYIHQSFRQA